MPNINYINKEVCEYKYLDVFVPDVVTGPDGVKYLVYKDVDKEHQSVRRAAALRRKYGLKTDLFK